MEYKTYEEIIKALKDGKRIIQKYPHNYRLTTGDIGNQTTKWLKIKYYYCNPQMNRTFAILEDGTKVDSSIDILDIAYGGFVDYIEKQMSVSFMEVVNSERDCRVEHSLLDIVIPTEEDNSYYYEFNNKGYLPLNCLLHILGGHLGVRKVKEVILEGKWYLEE